MCGDFSMMLDKKSEEDCGEVLISEGLRGLYPEHKTLEAQPRYEGADSLR
jgi:hypothetical protein